MPRLASQAPTTFREFCFHRVHRRSRELRALSFWSQKASQLSVYQLLRSPRPSSRNHAIRQFAIQGFSANRGYPAAIPTLHRRDGPRGGSHEPCGRKKDSVYVENILDLLSAAGSVKRKVAPLPSSDSTQIFPPSRSMNFRQNANPIPLPGRSAPCNRRNGSKIRE